MKQRILIVDDNETNRDLLNSILEDEYHLEFCEDGVEAVEFLEKFADRIDLMILDVVMPNLDGFGVLRKMNEMGWIKKVPVLLISVDYSPAFIEQAFELGAFDFISRPFNIQIIKRRMRNAIQFSQESDGSELQFMTIDSEE